MNKLKKIYYLFRRLGLKGTISHYYKTENNNEYELMYNHYYSKLKKEDYFNELCEWYDYALGRSQNALINPVTFNDKIQWLKLNDTSDLKTLCSDKYAVRKYVSKILGENYLIPLLGVWDSYEEIDFSKLPIKYVLKSNTGSGRIIIIDNNLDRNDYLIKSKVDQWQRIPFGFNGMEVQYLPIERKIIAEKFIEEPDGNLHDYKFHCFNGVPALVEFMGNRDLKNHTTSETWCDIEFKQLNIREKENGSFSNYISENEKPLNYEKMVEISKILSRPFMYVRVDLYNINGVIYFGELTFTPDNGLDLWDDELVDKKIGDLLDFNNNIASKDILNNVQDFFATTL